jgi:hypothetical protein
MKNQEIELKLSIDNPSKDMELIPLDKPKFNEEEKIWDYGTFNVVSSSTGVKFMTIHDILIKLNSNDEATVSFGTTSYKWNLYSDKSKVHATFHDNFTTGPGTVIHTFSTPFDNACNSKRKNHSGTYRLNNLFKITKVAKFRADFSYRSC